MDKGNTVTDQTELAVRARNGDAAAKTALVNLNIKFITAIARQYVNQGMELDDLVQEGCIGLLKAMEKYDPKMGTKFLTYASWWIKQSILQNLAENNRQVRIPANRISIIEQFHKTRHTLAQDLHREPSQEEVLTELGIEQHDLIDQVSFSYYKTMKDRDGNEGYVLDFLVNQNTPAPDAALLIESQKQELRLVLNKLPDREQTIIKMLYGIDLERVYTLEEVGEKLGLTRERVRQVKEKSLKALRRLNRRKKLAGLKD